MAIVTITEINLATTPLYWVELDSVGEKVKIIQCTVQEKGGITNLVIGPWLSQTEAQENINRVFNP